MTSSNARKMSLVPATQLTRYLTRSWTSGSSFDRSQALKTPTLLAYLEPGKK